MLSSKYTGMSVDEYVAAKMAEFPGLTQSQFNRLYGLLAPMRAELTALAKSRASALACRAFLAPRIGSR